MLPIWRASESIARALLNANANAVALRFATLRGTKSMCSLTLYAIPTRARAMIPLGIGLGLD